MTDVSLNDVIDRIKGNEDRNNTSLLYYVGGEHYVSNSIELRNGGLISEGVLGFKFHFPFRSGDVLFMARNPHLQKAARVDFDGICSDASYILRSKNENILLQDFLPLIVQSDHFWSFFRTNKTGSVNPLLNWSTLSTYKFNMPSLVKQRQYADLVWTIQYDINKLEEQLNLLDRVVKSQFIEMFGSEDNPKYGLSTISDLVSNDIEKVTKSFNQEDTIRYIDISSIDKESKSIVGMSDFLVKDAPSRAQQCVMSGDILLSNVRPNLKTIAIVDSDENNLVCSSGFTVLRCEKCPPEYLITAIIDDGFTKKLMLNATGSSYPAVTTKIVLSSTIPSAPLDLQNQFTDFVKQVDKSKFELQQHIDNTKKLQKTIINSIFQEP